MNLNAQERDIKKIWPVFGVSLTFYVSQQLNSVVLIKKRGKIKPSQFNSTVSLSPILDITII